jgi:hypothetical protein
MQHKYVVVCSDGTSYELGGKQAHMQWGQEKAPRFDLATLLAQGWMPIRESGMGGGDHLAFSLVLLGK